MSLPTLKVKDLLIKLTVHRSDTVSVVISCSYAPIAVDYNGIIRLSNALTRVEERLARLVERSYDIRTREGMNGSSGTLLQIPDHGSWIVTMWHFGTDGITEYTGEKFCESWEVGQNALIRVYTKEMKDKGTRVRRERQECPSKSYSDAIKEKLESSQAY